MPHIVWVGTPDGSTLYFNSHGVSYTGVTAPTYENWLALVHPDDIEGVRRGWTRAVVSGRPGNVECRLRRRDGEFRWHALRNRATLNDQGEVHVLIVTAVDIGAERAGAVALAEAQREAVEATVLLATLQAAAPVGFAFVDRDRVLVRANDEHAVITGRPVEPQLGHPVAELVPALWPQAEAAYRRVLDTGESVRDVSIVGDTAGDPGRTHEWISNCYPVRSGDEVIGVGFVWVDVTEQTNADEFRSAVMGQIADGVYTVDPDGRLMYMNKAASRMLGWTEDELCGQRMHDVIHFQRPDGTLVGSSECALFTHGTEGKLVRAVGEAFTRKDGSIFPVAVSSVPLYVGSEVHGVAVVFRDVSERSASSNLIRLLIVDTHAMTSEAFQLLLRTQEGVEVVGSAATSADAIAEMTRLRPDVVLLDYELPDGDGVTTARAMRLAVPEASVILMSQSYDAAVVALAIEAGCAGVLDKNRAWVELVGAVRAAFHGQVTLSQDDLQRVLPGLSAKRT
ncbi:MAG: hypothetical protein QOF21_716, partial [Actinomycetota bacterium]